MAVASLRQVVAGNPSTGVLLIDDDEDDFVLIESYLAPSEDGQFQLSWVRTFDEGLQALRQGRHDVFLVDFRLGADNGLRLLEQLQEEGLHRPVIILTGAGGGDLDQAALRAGAFDYLDKSTYSEADLRRSIRYAAERGRIERQLQLQAEILAYVHDAVFLVDETGVIRSWNRGAEQIFGVPAPQAIGSPANRLCPEITKFVSGKKRSNSPDGPEFSAWCQRASGEKVVLAVRLRFLDRPEDRTGRVIVCANDITHQVRLEQQLSDAAEAEQRRIGQDIHDDLCQQLAGAGCFLKAIEQRLSETHREQTKALESLGTLIAEANARARDISRGLFPAVLQLEGLTVALDELACRTGRSFGLACSAKSENVPRLPDSVAVQLYRIAQEAFSNAARHAKASRIDLVLAQTEDAHLSMIIRDDGQGIGGDSRSSGMGLVTMAHRTRILGGELDIHSARGSGTEIRVTLPLPLEETAS
jgi:PAS domain S-box-containing protein